MTILIYIALGLLLIALLLDKYMKEKLPHWVVSSIFILATVLFAIIIISNRLKGG